MMKDSYITRGCFHIDTEGQEIKRQLPHFCCGRNKMDVFNWMKDLPENENDENIVEIRFKNTRKAYYINNTGIRLQKGDVVAVEASPGHDVGVVSLVGALVPFQMRAKGIAATGLKKIYRKAKPVDTEKWFQSIDKEQETMKIARQMVTSLNLPMKISDVEYQGDKTKAIFYYISDDRVDFRQIIKDFAEHFRVRIEMKQIGARQEAGKVGGIGTCGRELCCAKWMASFASVSTSAARYQDLTLNPTKLAGQCGKLKCCLNFELKTYIDAQKDFPDTSIPLETEQGRAYHFKTDIFRRIIWYTFDKDRNNEEARHIPLDVDVVKEIISMNRQGVKAKELMPDEEMQPSHSADITYQNAVGEDSISRFEERRRKKKHKPAGGQPNNGARPQQPQGEKKTRPQENRQPKPNGDRTKQQSERNEKPQGNQQAKPQGNQQAKPQGNQNRQREKSRIRGRNRNGNDGAQPKNSGTEKAKPTVNPANT